MVARLICGASSMRPWRTTCDIATASAERHTNSVPLGRMIEGAKFFVRTNWLRRTLVQLRAQDPYHRQVYSSRSTVASANSTAPRP